MSVQMQWTTAHFAQGDYDKMAKQRSMYQVINQLIDYKHIEWVANHYVNLVLRYHY